MDPQSESLWYVDRRVFSRVPVDRPARLITAGGYRTAELCDLSRGGARLSLGSPPAEGTTALLRWDMHEVLCTVVWSSDIACGVIFETPISDDVVDKSASLPSGKARRDAGVTRIEFGKKRRALLPSGEQEAKPDQPRSMSWSIVLPHPSAGDILSVADMTAAQEMFFLGSPLAHVLCFRSYQGKALNSPGR